MGFADHVATAFGHLHTVFGEQDGETQITWDPDNDNITCNAIVGSKSITPGYEDGQDDVEDRPVTVQTADIADPQVGIEVVIDSVTYKTVAIERVGFGSARVQVARKVPVARAHEGHTKRMV